MILNVEKVFINELLIKYKIVLITINYSSQCRKCVNNKFRNRMNDWMNNCFVKHKNEFACDT